MAWGQAANVGVTLLAAVAYAAAAVAAQRRQGARGHRRGPAPFFFGLVAAYLVVAALRQVAAQAGSEEWDLRIYFLNVPFAALSIVPHAYLVALVRTGEARKARWVAAGFLVAVTVGIVAAWLGGVRKEAGSAYGTDWELLSPVANLLVAGAILLPGVLGSAWLVVLSRRLPEAERRRIALLGWATLGYFVLFTVDAYGVAGPVFLGLRVLTAGTGLLAWWAYQDAAPVVHTYAPPPDKPGENPFGR